MKLDISKVLETGIKLKDNKVKYKLGAKAIPPKIPQYLDCSGFVRYCYLAGGGNIPDGTYYQFNACEQVDKLEIGDLGFLQLPTDKGTNHVGIYIGDGKWMHCNYSRNGITIEKTKMFKYLRRLKNVEYIDKKEENNMAKVIISEKELGYGESAIKRLAELKIIGSPERHIEILRANPELWSLWVVQAKLAEKEVK